jgi:hypothetical protein
MASNKSLDMVVEGAQKLYRLIPAELPVLADA